MYWKYLSYVIKHKWFVFVAGLKVNVNLIQLITHDWSKFLPREFIPYARYFYGNYPKHDSNDPTKLARIGYYGKTTLDIEHDFKDAWNLHQKTQPHHWQYWVLINDSDEPKITALQMPYKYVKEMVADWMGAGRAITGKWEVHEWYSKTRTKIILHDETRKDVEVLLDILRKG